MSKIGIYYAYWTHNWDADFVPFVAKVKRLGFDVLEVNSGTVAEMSAAERQRREGSDFLRYEDSAGRFADFHSLRGVFATHLIAAGVDVKTAQELLGHATAKMTLDVYAKVLQGAKESAIARLPRYDRPEVATGTYGGAEIAPASAAKTAANGTQNGASASNGNHRFAGRHLALWSEKTPVNIGENGALRCTSGSDSAGTPVISDTPPRGFEPLSPA